MFCRFNLRKKKRLKNTKPPLNLLSLCQDVIELIATYLSFKDLLNLSSSCQALTIVLNSITHVKLIGEMGNKYSFRALNRFQNLQSIDIESSFGLTDKHMKVFITNDRRNHLKTLSIKNCSHISIKSLKHIIDEGVAGYIEYLNLSGCINIKSLRLLAQFENLKYLCIKDMNINIWMTPFFLDIPNLKSICITPSDECLGRVKGIYLEGLEKRYSKLNLKLYYTESEFIKSIKI
mmetsp:Transcript_2553/g.3689  ORF Transcript_2553/g.3689 Transcript_2553/m.3689 type:complete len:234 (-) Transcript_2553:1251-1952(-)